MTQAKTDGNNMSAEDLYETLHRLAYIEEKENDIVYMANGFEFTDGCWASAEEMYAGQAQAKINMAKQKIRELQEEIEKQEVIIQISERTIQKYKRHVKSEKTIKRGRPERSAYRERIAKKFMSQWVSSLKDGLEVKSCVKLEDMVSSISERNWRRWINGDALPSYTTFDKLLCAKIGHGKYAGEALHKVPTIPNHNDLLTLLRFV